MGSFSPNALAAARPVSLTLLNFPTLKTNCFLLKKKPMQCKVPKLIRTFQQSMFDVVNKTAEFETKQ